MSTQLRVGNSTATIKDAVTATMNKSGSFDAIIELVSGHVREVTIVALLNDAFVGTRRNTGRDVLIPFHAVAMLEIL